MSLSGRLGVCHLLKVVVEDVVVVMTCPMRRGLSVDLGGVQNAEIPVTPRTGIINVGLSCSKLLSSSFFDMLWHLLSHWISSGACTSFRSKV